MSRIFGKAQGKNTIFAEVYTSNVYTSNCSRTHRDDNQLANFIICQYKTDDGLFHKTDYVDYASTY